MLSTIKLSCLLRSRTQKIDNKQNPTIVIGISGNYRQKSIITQGNHLGKRAKFTDHGTARDDKRRFGRNGQENETNQKTEKLIKTK